MVVKDKVGRKRYIAFLVEANRNVKRHEMIRSINQSLPNTLQKDAVRLTAFNGEGGIVLCPHISKDAVCKSLTSINSMGGMNVKVKTIVTSGTIKKARAKLEPLVTRPLDGQ